ncbi:MAG: hypothetical protein KGH64_00805 [Candidatus Micrarchaeota archaeon]|nr:hypothetical protein [Candidatus Micrarchaeota archaeon]
MLFVSNISFAISPASSNAGVPFGITFSSGQVNQNLNLTFAEVIYATCNAWCTGYVSSNSNPTTIVANAVVSYSPYCSLVLSQAAINTVPYNAIQNTGWETLYISAIVGASSAILPTANDMGIAIGPTAASVSNVVVIKDANAVSGMIPVPYNMWYEWEYGTSNKLIGFNAIGVNSFQPTQSNDTITMIVPAQQFWKVSGSNVILVGYNAIPSNVVTSIQGATGTPITGNLIFTSANGLVTNSVNGNEINIDNYKPGTGGLVAGTGISIVGTTISMLPLTSGTGISVSSTNNVALLPLTSGAGITITSTNNVAMLPLTNTLPLSVTSTNGIGCPTCLTTSSSYVSSITAVNGVLASSSTGAVTLAVNVVAPVTNTMGEIGLSLASSIVPATLAVDSQGGLYVPNTLYTITQPLFINNVNSIGLNTEMNLGVDTLGNLYAKNTIYSFSNGLFVNSANAVEAYALAPITNSITIGCNACSTVSYTFTNGLVYNSVTGQVGITYNSPGLFIDGLGQLTANSVALGGNFLNNVNVALPLMWNGLNNTLTLAYNRFIFGVDRYNSLDIG